MADPSEITLIRDTGICYWNPVSSSNLGTQLGYASEGISLQPNYQITPLTFETTGLIPQKWIYSGMVTFFKASLLNISVDTLKRAFFQGGSTLDISLPGTPLTGTNLLTHSNAGKFLFVPKNSVNHPCFYSANCVAYMSPASVLKIHYKQVTDLDIVFLCESQRIALLSTLYP